MAPKALDILKKGLAIFSNKIKDRKNEINAKLSRNESISSTDERWLDHDANTVDEQRVLDDLEAASDFEQGLEKLDDNEKAAVTKLREWAGGVAKAVGNKRKRTNLHILYGKVCY